MVILTIIAMWLLAWLAAAIIGMVIFHFCLSPRRFEKHRQKYPPLPSGSIDRDDRSFQ